MTDTNQETAVASAVQRTRQHRIYLLKSAIKQLLPTLAQGDNQAVVHEMVNRLAAEDVEFIMDMMYKMFEANQQ